MNYEQQAVELARAGMRWAYFLEPVRSKRDAKAQFNFEARVIYPMPDHALGWAKHVAGEDKVLDVTPNRMLLYHPFSILATPGPRSTLSFVMCNCFKPREVDGKVTGLAPDPECTTCGGSGRDAWAYSHTNEELQPGYQSLIRAAGILAGNIKETEPAPSPSA